MKLENQNIVQNLADQQYDDSDPYVTKKTTWRDMLDGPIISVSDPQKGNVDAKVAIVYFSDFKCDFCRKQELVYEKIMEKYPNDVRLIWKDYPDGLDGSESFLASLSARCAGEQNKFWEFHNEIFSNNQKIDKTGLLVIANKLKLDTEKFADCLESQTYKKNILDNILEANALDINGVPFTYVNTQEIMGEISQEELERIIEIEIKK